MVHRSLYDANASPGFLFWGNVFLSMKNSKAAYSYFAMHFPQNLKALLDLMRPEADRLILLLFFSIAVQNHVRHYDYF